MPPTVTVSPDLQPVLRAGDIEIDLPGSGAAPGLAAEIQRVCEALRSRWGSKPPHEIEALEPARRLYRDLGIDPTKTRPSSEALLRRVLRGDLFPRILPAVDIGNLCSLEFMLSVGIYDRERIQGDVVVRRGQPGEGYAGIHKERVNLEGRLAVCDAPGPFGNPTSDSDRTKVTHETRRLLFLIFAPTQVEPAALDRHLALVRERYQALLA